MTLFCSSKCPSLDYGELFQWIPMSFISIYFNINHVVIPCSFSLVSPHFDICVSKVLLPVSDVGSKLMRRSQDRQGILLQTHLKIQWDIFPEVKENTWAIRTHYYECVGRYLIQIVSCIYLSKQCWNDLTPHLCFWPHPVVCTIYYY